MGNLDEFLPDDMDGRESLLAKFSGENGVSQLAQSYMEMEKRAGRSVSIPESADDEAWDRLMARLGTPATPNEYLYPEGVDADSYPDLTGLAGAASMTQRQFKAFAEKFVADAESDRARQAAEAAAEEDSIREQYGAGYDSALARAARAARQYGAVEGWETDPKLFSILEKVGARMTGSAPQGNESGVPAANPKKVAQQLRELMVSPAYNDSYHPEHETAMELGDALRMQLRELGFDSVMDDRLLGEYSPLRGGNGPRPWDNF